MTSSDLLELIQRHSTMFNALHTRSTHKFRWVMPPAIFDYMRAHTDQTWSVELPRSYEAPWTMFGMPIRVDEHASTTMLELL